MRGFSKRGLGAALAMVMTVAGGLLLTDRTQAAGTKSYTAAATPAALGVNTAASIAFTNDSRNDIPFAAINVMVPSSVTITAGSLSQSPVSATPIALVGSTIQLRDLVVAKGQSVTVSFTATAAAQAVCAPITFHADVRQSNDFNGRNNTFALGSAPASFTGPCASATVACTAGDGVDCASGPISNGSQNSASVVLNDGDGATGTLTASLSASTLTCPEYTPTSDRLDFDFELTAGTLGANATKTVTFTQPKPVGDTRDPSEYQVCFEAPYDFPALLPSELVDDTNNGDFSGNTTLDATTQLRRGLLLNCGLNQGVPCIESRAFTGPAGAFVTLVVTTAPLDPGMRW